MSLHFEFSSGRVADSRFCASFCYRIQGGIAPLVYGRGACRVVSVGAARRCGISRRCRLPHHDFCIRPFPGDVSRARLASLMIVAVCFSWQHCINEVRGLFVHGFVLCSRHDHAMFLQRALLLSRFTSLLSVVSCTDQLLGHHGLTSSECST